MASLGRPKLEFYRITELDEIAASILIGAEEYFHSYKFDIESFIVKKYKIKITPFFGLKSKWDIWAFMLVDSERIFVDHDLLDQDRLEKKYRFTIAEEFAHFLIHKEVYGECKDVGERIRFEESLPEKDLTYLESNARALASALLMPKISVEPRVKELLELVKGKPVDDLLGFLATALKKDYDVNFTSARMRLKNLGYHKRLEVG